MIEAVVISGFAGWRLASLLVAEDGPFEMFERLRSAVGVRVGEINQLAVVFTCIWCMSVWTSAAMLALYVVAPWAVAAVAAMGFALLVERFVRK